MSSTNGLCSSTGGWWKHTNAGSSSGASVRTLSSQPSVVSSSTPSSRPGMVESHIATVAPGRWWTWLTGRAAVVGRLEEVLLVGDPVVVVAGAGEHREPRRGKEFARGGVLVGRAVVGEVAGHEDRVDLAGQRVEVADHALRAAQRAGRAVVLTEVQVADVGEGHHVAGSWPGRRGPASGSCAPGTRR